MAIDLILPPVPVKHSNFLDHVKSNPKTPIPELVKPYNEYDAVLRRIYAQEPDHPTVSDSLVNVVPLFGPNDSTDLRIRARDLASETEEHKSKYLMALKTEQRKADGVPAVVSSLKDFQTNFNVFSESSLSDLDWNNVVAAGSAVATSILPVPDKYNDSKRGLRQFYHEQFAPASDVDLFLYGLSEEQAVEKIKQIEKCIRDSILTEISTIRTKHAVTIVSQYPTRHVQIVLRRYKSIAEILTGFDVDCSCAAYDGNQVYLAPRAVGAYMTQINRVDLTRRSPSYENRLSKYSHRGFEVFWPDLDRSRIDPSIFERSFTRTVGLARLLVLEKLPKSSDREQYLEQRRKERGRPPVYNPYRFTTIRGNIKDHWQDEVAEWVEEDEVSDYHTFTIPYGPKFHARKIEKLLYTKDLLLNAEWNKPKDREVNLHRHPAFFGSADDVMHDCCGYCPKPMTPEDEEVAAEESKIYLSGRISFLSDNPGRQEIGSFNPITDTDWTEMAYIGNTAGLCQAIVDHDLEEVQRWLAEGTIDVNRRDHTGRTPLHLACMASTPDIVQHLVDNNARLIARFADGRTALHLAAARGSVDIVRILLTRSERNEEEEAQKEDARKRSLKKEKEGTTSEENSDGELVSSPSDEEDADANSYATGSFVKVKKDEEEESIVPDDAGELDPDIYDINVLAWDSKASPLHLAILKGHIAVAEELVTSFGADILLPIKLVNSYNNSPRAAILTLVLALRLPKDAAMAMTEKLLQLGASPAQADINHKTALHYLAHYGHHKLLDVYRQHDQPAVERSINHPSTAGAYYNCTVESPLMSAIAAQDCTKVMKLLEMGAHPVMRLEDYIKATDAKSQDLSRQNSLGNAKERFEKDIIQTVILAVYKELPSIALELLVRGADPNTLTPNGYKVILDSYSRSHMTGSSLLDFVQEKLKVLRGYGGSKITAQKPLPLDPDDNTYLQGLQNGSYQMWTAKGMLQQERENYTQVQKNYQKAIKLGEKEEGLVEKNAAITALLADYEKLEADLLSRGAKTFKELHPDIESRPSPPCNPPNYTAKVEPYKTVFRFRARNYTEEVKEGYFQLFEAAWLGDAETIKSLTLTAWGPDKDRLALEIAATDFRNFSPFSIAILRGHLDTAKAILAISIAQYKPNDQGKNTRYRVVADVSDSDDGSDVDSEDIQLETHVIDGEYTIDNVGEAKDQVESSISPETVLQGRCNVNTFLEESQRPERSIEDLIQYAIWKDDIELLTLLISMGQELLARKRDESSIYTISTAQFVMAVRLGRLRCLEELIKRTGAGLPIDKLAESSGVEIKEKPKYYQGLSVHGKKRADWAAAGGGMPVARPMDMNPPLLLAAKEGNLAAVEWFLGTAPGRFYTEFAKAHKKDARLRKLALSKRGLEQSILDWLTSRRDLVLHCAVLSKHTEESQQLVAYLVENMPQCLEVKSADEYTPLAVAFQTHKLKFARILINAGANQAVRCKEGMNLLHLLLSSFHKYNHDSSFHDLLHLINPLLVPSMLVERCSSSQPGSLTPIALYMCKVWNNHHQSKSSKSLRTILDLADITGQKHLELLDGSGNTPLHTAINAQHVTPLALFLERRPDLLHRENAVGSTPAELAENKWISKMTSDPPQAPKSSVNYAYTGMDLSACHIVSKAAGEFVKKPVRGSTERDIYKLCGAKAGERESEKRKLVSLFDGNEVAKRLAMSQHRGGRHRRRRYDQESEEEGETDCATDEVSQWL
ncbi:ankyrin repeat-containing domain protein [Aspergillus cavernicola]|uniref:Ankyrin repeat-containing domain protein n=1 Tax=Aspergillus cavernicola TaxID=176166 RepID=A0ABR4I4K8_9EURO